MGPLLFTVLTLAAAGRFSVAETGTGCNCSQTSVICVIPVDQTASAHEVVASDGEKLLVLFRNSANATCVSKHLWKDWPRQTLANQDRVCRPNSRKLAVQQGLSKSRLAHFGCHLSSQGYKSKKCILFHCITTVVCSHHSVRNLKYVHHIHRVSTTNRLQVNHIEIMSEQNVTSIEADCDCEMHVIQSWSQGILLPASVWCTEGSDSLLASVQLQGTECELPHLLFHGSVSCQAAQRKQLATCHIECDRGYAINDSNYSSIISCQQGEWNASLASCSDVDECTQGGHVCDANADCINTPGSFACICRTCYEGNGFSCRKTTCPTLQVPAGGHVSVRNYFCGDIANFSCSEGYRLSGSSTRRCAIDGKWTGQQPTCDDINECTNGNHNCSRTGGLCFNTAGSYICSCDFCYSGNGSVCSFTDCGSLEPLLNGNQLGNRTVCGSRVSFVCAVGFELKGSPSRTCQNDGLWSGKDAECIDIDECERNTHNCDRNNGICVNTPGSFTCSCSHCYSGDGLFCRLIDCPQPVAPHGNVSVATTTCGSVMTVSCFRGYSRFGSSRATCQPDGHWSGGETNCTDIDECAVGNHNCSGPGVVCINTPGSFFCSCGTCYHGDGSSCSLVDCGDLIVPSNAILAGTGTTCGLNVTFSCSAGFRLAGSRTRSCQSSGEWSGIQPTCEDIDECNENLHNCGRHAHCANVKGSFTCACDQCYSGNGITCHVIDCGRLPVPVHGSVLQPQSTCGVSVNVSCNTGFALIGSSSRTCLENGSWSIMKMSCHDINECIVGTHTCDHTGGVCTNSPGSYNCSCDTCYLGNGTSCSLVDCGVPKSSIHTSWTGLATTCGSVGQLSCSVGYQQVGDDNGTIICRNDGLWSRTDIHCVDVNECRDGSHNCDSSNGICINTIGNYTCSCKSCYSGDGVNCHIIDCGSLSAPSHGTVSSLQSTCGATVVFSCSSGFSLLGSRSRTCLSNGVWNGSATTCNDIDECQEEYHNCSSVGGLCSNTLGSYSCSCQHCYTGNGWSCQLIDCGDVTSPQYGSVASSNTTCGSSLTARCSDGYRLTGATRRKCQDDGLWSGIEAQCSDTDECISGTDDCDSNAQCNNTQGSFTCTCDPCYSGDGVTCTVKTCSVLAAPFQGSISSSARLCGDSVTLSCNSGYRLVGPSSRQCGTNFLWSGSQPVCTDINECTEGTHNCARTGSVCTNTAGRFTCSCVNCYTGDGRTCNRIDCGVLTTPPQGTKSSSQTSCLTTVTFGCIDGFRLSGSSSRTCQNNRAWSGTQPTCGDIDECGEGTHDCDRTNGICTNTFGSHSCSCKNCYTGNGVSCFLVRCGSLSAPSHGNLSGSASTCGSIVTLSCSSGFSLSGSSSRTCQTSGEWSGFTTSCNDIDECSTSTHNCDRTSGICSNMAGGFSCTCKSGYTGNGFTCFPNTYNVRGLVKDGSTNMVIRGASVLLGSSSTTTENNGLFSFTNVTSATYNLSASASGYVSNIKTVRVFGNINAGTVADIILTKILTSGAWKVVLTWGKYPEDLDSYMITPNDCVVSYDQYVCNSGGADVSLDVDDVESYGPETIHIDAGVAAGVYRHYVVVLDSSSNFSASAKAELYGGDRKFKTILSPLGGFEYWDTFNINTANNSYTSVNSVR